MTGVKVSVLLVARIIDQFDTASYTVWAEDGLFTTRNFTHNLGVPTSFFGQPATGRSCLTGLWRIDLYVYSDTSLFNASTEFLFTESNLEITDLSHSNLYACASTTLCLAICAPRYYYNNMTNTCSICPYDCYTCNNLQQCTSCNTNDHRYLNTTRCLPNPGFYETYQSITLQCPNGCSSCASSTNCTGCHSGYVSQDGICQPVKS